MSAIKFYSGITALVLVSFLLAALSAETGRGEEALRVWFEVASAATGMSALLLVGLRIFKEED